MMQLIQSLLQVESLITIFVGMAGGGSSGGSGGGGNGGGADSLSAGIANVLGLSVNEVALLGVVALLTLVAAMIMRFGTMTTREGFRAGWAHWGVLVRIALLYLAVTIGSLALLAAPCVIALQALGPIGAVVLGIPVLFVAVPWLVTLYLVQAFASRIAVLESRHAFDAIAKSRLFLHGRLMHGLKLIVAMFVGTLAIVFLGIVAMLPVALFLAALIPVLRVFPVIVIGCLVLLPAIYVVTAVLGTFRSSIWTIGYVTQVEA
jgi:hypothetical protein